MAGGTLDRGFAANSGHSSTSTVRPDVVLGQCMFGSMRASSLSVREEVPMDSDPRWQWLRRHGLAVVLAAVAIVLFLLFSGYLTD